MLSYDFFDFETLPIPPWDVGGGWGMDQTCIFLNLHITIKINIYGLGHPIQETANKVIAGTD